MWTEGPDHGALKGPGAMAAERPAHEEGVSEASGVTDTNEDSVSREGACRRVWKGSRW